MAQLVNLPDQERVIFSRLPLAIYQEIAAHLRQIPAVKAQLCPLETDRFDYSQSQVGYLQLQYPNSLSPSDRQQLESILAFYGDRYSPPQRQKVK